jgi:ankyrin repeat protein
MFSAIENSNVGLMKDIIDRFTHQEEYNSIMDAEGNTLIALATRHGDHAMIKLLVESGFDPNQANDQGDTPMHHAIGN